MNDGKTLRAPKLILLLSWTAGTYSAFAVTQRL